ncbi:MAG: hypothetical protein LBT47_12280 [Deltaproteobacteria bacterium]|jgi:hypothetical protein|nr:hypothetical protein [Deltaproteobacteria bacterium]
MGNLHNNNQGQTIVINGRRIPIGNGLHGHQLNQAAGAKRGRRTVMVDGIKVQTVEHHHFYHPHELVGRNGKPIKVNSIPDRTKGGLFDEKRDQASKDLIRRQIYDLAANFAHGGLDFDEDNSNWVIFPHFKMPEAWGVSTSALMVIFPDDYPRIPPIGFYLPSKLSSPYGHFFNQTYHEASGAPIKEGWNWYCCYISGVWRPAPDDGRNGWKFGDNLWTYLTLINEVLTSGPTE